MRYIFGIGEDQIEVGYRDFEGSTGAIGDDEEYETQEYEQYDEEGQEDE